MQFLNIVKSLFPNLCFPFRKKPAFKNEISSAEFDTKLTRLNQELLRLDVKLAMLDAEQRKDENQRLKEYFGKCTTESNHSSRENLKRIIKLLRNRRHPGPDDEEGMGIPIR